MRKPNGPLIYSLITNYILALMILMAVSYGAIWLKIRSGTKKVAASSGNQKIAKYNKSAKVMTIFVFAYFVQYWPVLVQGFWVLATPLLPVWLIVAMVLISNMGGLFNLTTYTVIRKRFTTTGKTDDEGTTATTVTVQTDTTSTRVTK